MLIYFLLSGSCSSFQVSVFPSYYCVRLYLAGPLLHNLCLPLLKFHDQFHAEQLDYSFCHFVSWVLPNLSKSFTYVTLLCRLSEHRNTPFLSWKSSLAYCQPLCHGLNSTSTAIEHHSGTHFLLPPHPPLSHQWNAEEKIQRKGCGLRKWAKRVCSPITVTDRR